jgi:hypothetical protein
MYYSNNLDTAQSNFTFQYSPILSGGNITLSMMVNGNRAQTMSILAVGTLILMSPHSIFDLSLTFCCAFSCGRCWTLHSSLHAQLDLSRAH